MFSFIAFAVLVGAVSELGGPIHALSPNPIIELNRYLYGKFEQSYHLMDRLEKVQKSLLSCQSSTMLDSQAKSLAQLISKFTPINDANLCGKANLDNLKQTLATFSYHDEESFKEPQRDLPLNKLLADYTEEVFARCLQGLENEITSLNSKRSTDKISGLSDNLMIATKRSQLTPIEDIVLAKEAFVEKKLGFMFEALYCHGKPVPCSLGINPANGRAESLSLEKARESYKEYLHTPCESFLKDQEVQAILERVIVMSESALLVQYHPQFSWHKQSVTWASAAEACKMLKTQESSAIIYQATGRRSFFP